MDCTTVPTDIVHILIGLKRFDDRPTRDRAGAGVDSLGQLSNCLSIKEMK